ncbi:hypothetical protein SpCBS45565_g04425 [Spizellomyces sp. 'palustris']|nr:hypothetical protein SpCBS45565_g04425 [Spizellomyces sp. 'palustris']
MSGTEYRISGGSQQSDEEDEHNHVIETDPTGRFERYAECLGKGAYKEVFKAFDTEEGVEVAWNQLRIDHLLKREAQRILSEIQILESLRNDSIINMYHSWIAKGKDGRDKVYFITELMTSGTLKSYIRKTKGAVKPKVLKSWCRQILSGLHYLHTRDPPIIHRDLKCENVFINGNNGQAKIGDLGLAVAKHRDHVSSVLGTPEFMAPELYDEKYDEKVDIYAFGMMMLEIITKEYPYSECTNQAQIYKKVSSGIKPRALQKIEDDETRRFVELCIAFNPYQRPTAEELLRHPFLIPTQGSMVSVSSLEGSTEMGNEPRGAKHEHHGSVTSASSFESPVNGDSGNSVWHSDRQPATQSTMANAEPVMVDAENHTFEILKRGHPANLPPHASGTVCSVEVVERLSDEEVQVKMIYTMSGRPSQEIKFPFSIAADTSRDVVGEMVREGIIDTVDEPVAVERLENAVRAVISGEASSSEGGSVELRRVTNGRPGESYERGASAERYGSRYPSAHSSPPLSPATFPRYRQASEPEAPVSTLVRHNTMPRSVSNVSIGHANTRLAHVYSASPGSSPVPSPITTSPTMRKADTSDVRMGHGHSLSIESVASRAESLSTSSSSRPVTPLGGEWITERPSVEDGIKDAVALQVMDGDMSALPAVQDWSFEGGALVPTHIVVPHPTAVIPPPLSSSLPSGLTLVPHPPIRVDTAVHKKLAELQELNLRGFGNLASHAKPSSALVSSLPTLPPSSVVGGFMSLGQMVAQPRSAPIGGHRPPIPFGSQQSGFTSGFYQAAPTTERPQNFVPSSQPGANGVNGTGRPNGLVAGWTRGETSGAVQAPSREDGVNLMD